MNTAELKIDLINQITNLTDNAKLQELLQFIQFQSNTAIHTTNNDEKEAIFEALSQISNNEILSDESVRKEIKECLGE